MKPLSALGALAFRAQCILYILNGLAKILYFLDIGFEEVANIHEILLLCLDILVVKFPSCKLANDVLKFGLGRSCLFEDLGRSQGT